MNKKNKINVRVRGGSFLSNTLNKNKKLLTITVILIVTVFIVLSGKSYAYLEKSVEGSYVNLQVGKIIHSLNSNVILEAGDKIKLNLFVKSNENIDSKYQVYYTSESNLSNVVVGYTATSVDLPYGNLEAKDSKNIMLIIENKSSSKVEVEIGVRSGLASNSIEDIILEDGEYRINQLIGNTNYIDSSGANEPQLTSGMIPVVYSEGNWVKADLSETWYDYNNQIWANAVTVTEATRDTYMKAVPNTPISMNDINTMWVWIPRYEYQYTNLGTSYAGGTQTQPGEIKINFISSDIITPSDANTYKIPEGFTFGAEEIPGFWIGKFETSTLETCTATESSVNTGCDLTTLTPQVKPNVISWRGARVSTFFETSRLMQDASNTNIYGFDVEGASSMDVHMLKNTEWGIVAILSQSKYGKYGNQNYTGANKEVYQNKSSSYFTGMSNGTPSTATYANSQVTYDTENTGYGASTTGTIYGVYDMSGGAYEYVMGNYSNYSGYSTSYNSGFCETDGPTDGICHEWPDSKYVDIYTSKTASSAYKFGDATYETSSWYSDNTDFITNLNPWFSRGGYCSDNSVAGVFNSDYGYGKSYFNHASRLAIKP